MKNYFSKTSSSNVLLNVSTILIVAIMLVADRAFAGPYESSAAPQAQFPGVLSYQGTLVDAAGNPVSGAHSIDFRLYNVPDGGTPLWEEAHSGDNAVPVQNGLFNVMLGSLNPIPETVWEQAELFLGVKIGSDAEMSPREKLTFVPGANVAQMAMSVADGSITQIDAPSLVSSANSQNVKIYFGLSSAVSIGTNTLLAKTVSVSPACNNLVNVFVQPLYDWTPYTIATIGNPWDGSQFTVFLSRTDGGAWGDGQNPAFSYFVICQQ